MNEEIIFKWNEEWHREFIRTVFKKVIAKKVKIIIVQKFENFGENAHSTFFSPAWEELSSHHLEWAFLTLFLLPKLSEEGKTRPLPY